MFDINKIRQDFPMLINNPENIYFDNGATTYKPISVIEEVNNFYRFESSNVHRGDYDISARVSNKFDEVRRKVANFINADVNEIVFTSGATQGLNQAAFYGQAKLNKGDIVLTTLSEHASSILPWFRASEAKEAKIEYLKLKDGLIDIDDLKRWLETKKVKFLVFAHVSNVLGQIQPVKEISKIAHEYGALVILDGAQSVPHMKIDVKDLDIDILCFSSHKMCGPSGVGVMYGRASVLEDMEPLTLGGGSNSRFDKDLDLILKKAPYKFEAGTPNIEGVLGFGRAIDYLESIGINKIHAYELDLKNYMVNKLKKLDNIILYNENSDTGIVSFNAKEVFAQDAASFLNSKNISVRSGNHCAKLLKNIIDKDDTVRASLYFYNTYEEIDRFIEAASLINLENAIGIFF